MRRLLAPFLLAPLLAGLACSPVHAAEDPATVPILALDSGLAQAMRQADSGVDFQTRMRALTPAVQRAFDLPAVMRAVVGLRWEAMPADQQRALLDAFTRFTVATYVANFGREANLRFDLAGHQVLGQGEVVATRLVGADNSTVKLDYVVRPVNGYWQATDVLLDGSISRAAVLRSDFRNILKGGAPALIRHLDEKTLALAGSRG